MYWNDRRRKTLNPSCYTCSHTFYFVIQSSAKLATPTEVGSTYAAVTRPSGKVNHERAIGCSQVHEHIDTQTSSP